MAPEPDVAQEAHDDLYPEHAKLRPVAELTQAAGEFLEWLRDRKGFFLATHQGEESLYAWPVQQPLAMLLAEWQGIDPVRLEQEKAHMLRAIRDGDGADREAPLG